MKTRLDLSLVARGLVKSRSQAESYIKLGLVLVNSKKVVDTSFLVGETDKLKVTAKVQYVSRAALKLDSIMPYFKIDFTDKVVLDVGSSTGGFTDYSLRNGADYVISVDVGTDQMESALRKNLKVELHEKTDIRDIYKTTKKPDIVLIDVSFISQRQILKHVLKLLKSDGLIVSLFKPQFESGKELQQKGVIKNSKIRRQIMHDFESWLKANKFIILNKADSKVEGSKGNQETFYLLKYAK